MGPDQNAPIRVVIAGMGAVSSQGDSVDALWEASKAGRVAIHPLRRLPTEGYRSHIGGEAHHPVTLQHDYRRPEGYHEPIIDFSLKAAEEAMSSSGLGFDAVPADRWGLALGNSMGAFLSLRAWYIANVCGDGNDPSLLLLGPAQSAVETIGAALGFGGPHVSVTNSCAAGASAIGLAMDLIRFGQADAMLAGGSECLTDLVYAAFNCIEALSPEPATPYAAHRQGLSLGEGSGLLLLVREEIARRAGVQILGEVLGYGLSADGYDPTAPEPTGAGMARAMRAAMQASGISPEDVDYVNGHGTGTAKNDPAESRGIRLALGPRADRIPVSSTKSMIGHLLGGAGGVESVVTVRALQEQIAPPTAGYRARDVECDLDYVPNVARPMPMDVALSNNFAFGGANATVALARYRPDRNLPAPRTERVVVTGITALAPDGMDISALSLARSKGRRDGGDARRVQVDPAPFLNPRNCRRMDRLSILSVVAAARALEDAALAINPDNRDRIGVAYGTGLGPLDSIERFWRPLFEEGPVAANPALSANLVHNAAPGQVSIRTGAVGPNTTVTGGHAAGAMALCSGYMLIRDARADAMICVAADTITGTVVKAYQDLGLLSPESSFSLAEMGTAVVVETLTSAWARGARIYGEITGFGLASDTAGAGRLDPHGSGLERAMRLALGCAGLRPDDIGTIWASACGYRPADVAERSAIHRVFRSRAKMVSPKAVLGEPVGAGGPLNLALALQCWNDGSEAPPRPVLINSCSLGGTHVALVVSPFTGRQS
jgi:3-oxoacyl-[acyl-carrier-protein] synthase II